MPYALTRYTGNGSNTFFSVPFPFLQTSHVRVFLGGVPQTTGFIVGTGFVSFTTAPGAGVEVKIQRESSRSSRLVDYQDASTLTEAVLDRDSLQAFYLAQEALDAAEDTYVQQSGGRYMGPKAQDPTLANDGSALLPGDLYYNTTTGTMRVRTAVATWDDTAVPVGSFVAKAGDTMTGPLSVPSVSAQQVVVAGSNVSPFSFRNRIINGRMDIAQRGPVFPAAPSGTFMVDRFTYQTAGTTAVVTASQEPALPTNEFQFSAQITVTTADVAVAAGDVAIIEQRIEGFNARDLIGRPITLSFWVRSPKAGTHCAAFRNNLQDRSFVATYNVNVANAWEFKSVTVPAGLITAGGWNWTTGIGLSVSWALMAGAAFQTGAAGAWQTGNAVATAAQVNVLDAVGNVFNLTGVQLEVGSVATPFEHRPLSEELSACQRYYETGSFEQQGNSALAGIVDHCVGPVGFRVTKRAAPTILKSAAVFSNCGDQTTGVSTDSFRQFVRTLTATSFYAVYTWAANSEL
jgi:hypothetical protein